MKKQIFLSMLIVLLAMSGCIENRSTATILSIDVERSKRELLSNDFFAQGVTPRGDTVTVILSTKNGKVGTLPFETSIYNYVSTDQWWYAHLPY